MLIPIITISIHTITIHVYRLKLGCDSAVASRVMRWICVLAVAAILEINTITVLGKLDRTV